MPDTHQMKFQRRMAMNWTVLPCLLVSLLTMPCPAQDVALVSSLLGYSLTTPKAASQPGTTSSYGSDTNKSLPKDLKKIQPGEKMSTGENDSKSVILGTTGTARMGPDTEIQIPKAEAQGLSLEMLKGKLYLNISAEELKKRKAGEFRLKTPAALLAVKGTKFFTISENGTDTVGVHDGSVAVTEPVSKTVVNVASGSVVTVSPGRLGTVRPLTDGEKGYAREYDACTLVKSPLTLAVEPSQKNSPGAQLSAYIIKNGYRVNLTTAEYEKLKKEQLTLSAVSYGERSGGGFEASELVYTLHPDGKFRHTWQYKLDYTKSQKILQSTNGSGADEPYSRYVLYAHDINGHMKIGPVVALQFKMRAKNISIVHLNSNVLTSLNSAALFDGQLHEVMVPFEKQDNFKGEILFLRQVSTQPANKNTISRGTSLFEISDFVLISLPK